MKLILVHRRKNISGMRKNVKTKADYEKYRKEGVYQL